MADKQLKSLTTPQNDKYLIQININELENILLSLNTKGGLAFKTDLFSGSYSDLKNKPDLSLYALKSEIPSGFVTINQLDIRTKEIKNNLIGTDSDTKESNTIKGAINTAQSFANKALEDAKTYVINQITADKLPKASKTNYGVVKIGQGLAFDSNNYLIATGEGVTIDSIDWNNVINKPLIEAQTLELGAVATSNNYSDLDNLPDLSNYLTSQNLPKATTSNLGCIKIDGTTIQINDDGVISSSSTGGSTVIWRTWTRQLTL